MTDDTTAETAETLLNFDDLTAVISLNPDELEQEIVQFTAQLSRLGRRLAHATRVAALAHLQTKRVEAQLRLNFRAAAEVANQKIAKDDMDAAVVRCDAYQAAHAEEIEANNRRDELKADVRSLEGKERMLVLLGNKQIAEFRKDPAAALASAATTYTGERL